MAYDSDLIWPSWSRGERESGLCTIHCWCDDFV